MEIAEKGDYIRLHKSGLLNVERLSEAWESIVKENGKHTGSNKFNNYLVNAKVYGSLVADYLMVRSALTYLSFKIDDEMIELLAKKGYRIDKSSSVKYAESINSALRRSENIGTQAIIKQNEIKKLQSDKKEGTGFEQVMAMLSLQLGFPVPDDITLARFNEYQKLIKQKDGINTKQRNKR
jgi:hypothetical protein